MNKSLIALATALIAATTMFASTAEAGFGIRIGFGPIGFASHGGYGGASEHTYRKRERVVRRQEKAPARVTKPKKAPATAVAKKEEALPATTVAEVKPADSENSSITVAAAEVSATSAASTEASAIAAPATVETASAETNSPGCKKFFASVGMTLSVPCE